MPTVSFQVNDAGVSSYIQKLKSEGSSLTASMIQEASKQSAVAKEQLKYVEEQIRAKERTLSLDTKISEQAIRRQAEERIITSSARITALREGYKEKLDRKEISTPDYLKKIRTINKYDKAFDSEAINQGADNQVSLLKEQARNQSLLLQAAKEQTQTIRTSSSEQSNAIKKGDQQLGEIIGDSKDPIQNLTNRLANESEQQRRSKGQESEEQKSNKLTGQWKEFARALAFDKVGGMVAGMPAAQNSLDYIKPMTAMMGMALGGGIGLAIDTLVGSKILGTGLGQTNVAGLGTALGEKAGEFMGSALERTYKNRDELTKSNFRLKSLVGNGIGDIDAINADSTGGTGTVAKLSQNLEKFGLSMSEVAGLQADIATRAGSGTGLGRKAEDIKALELGLGVQTQTSYSLLELVRQKKSSDRDLVNIVSGVLGQGIKSGIFKDGDRSYLNEFLTKNFSQLHKSLLSTNATVSSGLTMDILSKFNEFGGLYSAKDSRSSGYINSIQGALSAPKSDSMKALAYQLMKQDHPEMDNFDIGIEIQKGMGSKKYFSSMMKQLTSMGGDRAYQGYNVASAFGLDNNLMAADELIKGYKSGKGVDFTKSELRGDRNSIISTAEGQVSPYSIETARIQNAFTKGAIEGIEEVGTGMKRLFGKMIDGVEKHIENLLKEKLTPSKTTNPVPKLDKYHTPYANL